MDRPSLDHFIGREVVSTRTTQDSHKIILEGDVVIISTRALPEGLKGKKLTQVILSEDEARAVFFDTTVSLHPTNYMIETPDLKAYHPALPEELERGSEDDVPDPSKDRIFDGPENDPERSVLDMRDEEQREAQEAENGTDELTEDDDEGNE